MPIIDTVTTLAVQEDPIEETEIAASVCQALATDEVFKVNFRCRKYDQSLFAIFNQLGILFSVEKVHLGFALACSSTY